MEVIFGAGQVCELNPTMATSTRITFFCDPTAATELLEVRDLSSSEVICTYEVLFRSSAACPVFVGEPKVGPAAWIL